MLGAPAPCMQCWLDLVCCMHSLYEEKLSGCDWMVSNGALLGAVRREARSGEAAASTSAEDIERSALCTRFFSHAYLLTVPLMLIWRELFYAILNYQDF